MRHVHTITDWQEFLENKQERSVIYFIGYLAKQRGRMWRTEAGRICEAALHAAHTPPSGISLVQRKINEDCYEYIATKGTKNQGADDKLPETSEEQGRVQEGKKFFVAEETEMVREGFEIIEV